MNKFVYKLRQYFRNRNTPDNLETDHKSAELGSVLRSRAIAMVGEDVYEQRRLYEQFVSKDHWRLKDEAVYLVLGYDPEKLNELEDEALQSVHELYEHAKHCISQNLSLTAINQESEPEDWKVVPTEFYRWASVSRVQMPAALSTLMDFVISTVKGEKERIEQAAQTSSAVGESRDSYSLQREQTLGAALAVMAEFPEQCRNSKGRLSVRAITALIQQHRSAWFQDEDAMMSETTMQDLINKWIKTLKPAIHG